ncbi:MAG: glycosyltransferase [Verrucomicrobiae bacterium]|nr:glycosyltransferase [Verrucomicrobiae bacterium]
MILIVLHHHFRPGGVRRVIEKAVPAIVRYDPHNKIERVILVSGEPIPAEWMAGFRKNMGKTPVGEKIWTQARYASEQFHVDAATWRALLLEWRLWISSLDNPDILIWTHNLSVGRNASLAHALSEFSRLEPETLQIWTCHDFWFDGRLQRWPEMRAAGASSVLDVGQWLFPDSPNVRFACINHIDYQILHASTGWRTFYLPNIAEPAPAIPETEKAAARKLLMDRTGGRGSPAWLIPCRVLRRKNIAESLLITRLLKPDAWTVTTGQAGSPSEKQYALALSSHTKTRQWRLHLGILGNDTPDLPSVAAMIDAAQTILLTSVQEGFGLPFLEAAAARKPLVARVIPNVMSDLIQSGLNFPQTYEELLVPVSLLNWKDERESQRTAWEKWRSLLPAEWSGFAEAPPALQANNDCVPFSRLTLEGQLDILSHSDDELARACLDMNPRLRPWRERAGHGSLAATEWPPQIEQHLGPRIYASRFWMTADSGISSRPSGSGQSAQDALARLKLTSKWLFPILW